MLSTLRNMFRNERGALLLEVVVAIGVLTLVGTAALSGVATANKTKGGLDSQAMDANLVRNQMEAIFADSYQTPPTTYPAISAPSGYTITNDVQEYVTGDSNIEKIVVTVTHAGHPPLSVETLRTNG